jgi:lysozyme
MTAWAVSLLNDPKDYPLFATATKQFGPDNVLARVEWHPWTYRNGIKVTGTFRGITLYEMPASPQVRFVEGIDVSKYQKKIEWKKVASSKTFVFIKATEGINLVDSSFASNWEAAKATGLLRGAYHFFHPKLDPISQAEFFLSKATNADLPPVLDVETMHGASGAQLIESATRWLEYVTAQHKRPLIYTSPSFWESLPQSTINQKADLWLAEWDTDVPSNTVNWPGWSFWQYTSTGTVPGIPGTVDLNRFNGTVNDLHAYLTRVGDPGDVKPVAFDLRTVIGVQRALNFLKIAEPPLVEDGVNGRKTKTAVRAFQQAHGLVADGVVGEKTRAALETLVLELCPNHV